MIAITTSKKKTLVASVIEDVHCALVRRGAKEPHIATAGITYKQHANLHFLTTRRPALSHARKGLDVECDVAHSRYSELGRPRISMDLSCHWDTLERDGQRTLQSSKDVIVGEESRFVVSDLASIGVTVVRYALRKKTKAIDDPWKEIVDANSRDVRARESKAARQSLVESACGHKLSPVTSRR